MIYLESQDDTFSRRHRYKIASKDMWCQYSSRRTHRWKSSVAGGRLARAFRQTQYGFVYVMAATCAKIGQAEGLIASRLDTPIVNLFLAQLAATLEPNVQAVLAWDGAECHWANDLICPSNITLVSLLPYSSELNPVENLWHDLRSHHWSNRMYSTVDLFDAAETAWRSAYLDPAITRTVCHAPYVESHS